MGKWGVDAQEDSVSIVDCDDKEWLLEMRGSNGFDIKTARQICLMHNEGVELLKWIKDDIVMMAGTTNKSPAKDYRDRITSLLKRMGVDCG